MPYLATSQVELVEEIGPKKWSQIAQRMPGRIGKQVGTPPGSMDPPMGPHRWDPA